MAAHAMTPETITLDVDTLSDLAFSQRGYAESGAWWARLAGQLDLLWDQLCCLPVPQLTASVRRDAPDLLDLAAQLPTLGMQAQAEVEELRRNVATAAGRPSAAAQTREELRAVLRHVSLINYLVEDLQMLVRRRRGAA